MASKQSHHQNLRHCAHSSQERRRLPAQRCCQEHGRYGTVAARPPRRGTGEHMRLAYIDETGDTGNPNVPGASRDYTLGVVLVDEKDWTAARDVFVAFRYDLRRTFGIPIRAEIKAHYLATNKGPFKSLRLSSDQRRDIFARHLKLVERLSAVAFAVHVDKMPVMNPTAGCVPRAPDAEAWQATFQRFATTYRARHTDSDSYLIHLSHDEGNDANIRRHARRAGTHLTAGSLYGSGSRQLPSGWLIDDPVPRQSHESLFIQLADLVAWSASRTMRPPGASGRRVMPQWTDLGAACFAVVNQRKAQRDPSQVPGIVVIK